MLTPNGGSRLSGVNRDKANQLETSSDIAQLKDQLRIAEEMGEYAVAGKLRKKIAAQELEDKDGTAGKRLPQAKSSNDKDRKAAIEIASKCIDQAFEFATESLNNIGLPLTPRLAEYLRCVWK